MNRPIREGSWVRVRLPRRRGFTTKVHRLDDTTVDITDPRTGGLRTIPLEYVRLAKTPRSQR